MDLDHRSRAVLRPIDTLAITARDDVLVVLPTYNEAENLRRIVTAIRTQGVRVLIVDDGSPDGTGDIANALAFGDDWVRVLHRPAKTGLGPAYAAGFATGLEAGAEILCEMDADFSHDPTDLLRLVAEVDDGADLVIGSRYVPGGGSEGWPIHRRAVSRGGNLYARLLLGLKVRDVTGGYRAFRSSSLRKLDPESCEASGYGFQIEMVHRAVKAGLDVREVPITFREREAGMSKMSPDIALEAMRLVTRWGFQRR